jgi:hypothetical protein
VPAPSLARWLLALGIAATLTANMAQGWSHGPVGAVIAAWPAVSLVGSLVHPCLVSGNAADAPEVPPGHRPARSTLWTSIMSSAGPGGYPGRADRRQGCMRR